MKNTNISSGSKAAVILTITLLFSSFKISEWEYDKSSKQKINKSIISIFNTRNYIIEELFKNDGLAYILKDNNSIIGYLLISQAPSKFHKFDYYIICDLDLAILKVEILKYRENYGMEICNKRWLKKFIKISTNSYNEYNRKIDSISGATISVNSLKESVFRTTKNLKKSLYNNYKN